MSGIQDNVVRGCKGKTLKAPKKDAKDYNEVQKSMVRQILDTQTRLQDEEESWLQDPLSFWNELDKFYGYLLTSLQPAYRRIGDEEAPVLGALEKKIYGHPLAGLLITSEESLFTFLSIFFRPAIVYEVECTFDMTKDSVLGEEYTRRGTYSSAASTLVFDLCHKARLMSARSQIAVSAGGSSSGSTRDSVEKHEGAADLRGGQGVGGEDRGVAEEAGIVGHSGAEEAGIGGDGGGAEEDVVRVDAPQAIFTRIPIQDIRMPLWTTPEKKRRMTTSEMNAVRVTIRERTMAFVTHPVIRELLSSTPGMFDMFGESKEEILLFHGTRTEHLPEFQRAGIVPPYVRNELSTQAAFYVTDQIEYAFEHPIHKHALGNAERRNHILIFAFRVNVHELCVSPGGGEAPFHIRKFLSGEDQSWLQFCVDNLNQVITRDRYDIVMGPVCTPKFDQYGKVNHVKLLTWGAESGHRWFKQIAFISSRAQDWLQNHLVCILRELRED